MPIPVISIAQMREWETATWATGQTEAEVIRRVGQQLARLACNLTRPGDSILILAGKGHNGDDARATREFLDDREIILLNVTDPKAALAKFQSSASVPPAPDRRDGAHPDTASGSLAPPKRGEGWGEGI